MQVGKLSLWTDPSDPVQVVKASLRNMLHSRHLAGSFDSVVADGSSGGPALGVFWSCMYSVQVFVLDFPAPRIVSSTTDLVATDICVDQASLVA